MEKFWKAFFALAGLCAVACIVFFAIHRQWFALTIFGELTPSQTFWIAVISLVLSFGLFLVGVVAWARSPFPPIPPPPFSVSEPGEPTASREFLIGRWEAPPKAGEMDGGSYMEYFENGRCEIFMTPFFKSDGPRTKVQGTWETIVVSRDKLHVAVKSDGGETVIRYLKLTDHNRIRNMTDECDTVRVVR